MIRIICTECKNAYLQNKEDKLVCPSCEATYNEEAQNLLLGVQYYNEENYTESDNYLMKYIVKNGAEPLAVVYKALCDARSFDEDTVSLEDTYKKILDAFVDVSDEDFPKFIAIANDEAERIEKALTESHVRLFADADAEKIKKEVANILNIQNEAKAFRAKLGELVADFNDRSQRKISVKYSDCFYVEKEIAAEVGDIKYQKICDNIASHTVFTGILTNDIKNLEIYYRCIVMFFQKSHDKYEFLLTQAEKFILLSELLEKGQYNTIKGTGAIADKLKSVSYEFLQESYKEHFDEQIDMQTETVVIIEPEIVEEPVIEEIQEEPVTEETTEAEEIVEAVFEEVATEEETIEIEQTESLEVEKESEESVEEPAEEFSAEEIESFVSSDDDIIEFEVEESPVEEEEKEIEDVSSTSEVDEIADIPEEATDVNDEIKPEEASVDKADEITDDVIEIEKEPQYEVVECNIPEINDTEEPVVEEVVLEEETIEEKPPKEKKKKNHKGLILFVLIIILAGLFAGYKYGPELINSYKYDKAVALAESEKYADAITAFKDLGDYSDSQEKALECEYNSALKFEEDEKYSEAKVAFENLGDYGDSKTRAQACAYSEAKEALDNNNFDAASKLFIDLGDYGDSKEMVKECSYRQALSLIENKEYESAIEILTAIKKYSDAKEKITEAKYMYVTDNFDKDNKKTVKYLNELTTANYRNSAELRKELLGSSEVMSADIKAFVNYSSTDLETSLTELDNTRVIYFHAVVNDKALYGQTLTLKYTTAFGYSQKQTVTLSESDNVAVMSYPSTQHKNYTVEFELLDSTGKKVASQKISF